jgi:hypothetical protein
VAALEQSPGKPGRARPSVEPGSIVLAFGGRIARTDIRGLCNLIHVLLEDGDAEVVVCDLAALIDPDAATVDALARLQLTARRLGGEVRVRHACDELQDLIALMGLRGVVPLCEELPLEPRGKTEKGEQACGFEEEGDPGDPAI